MPDKLIPSDPIPSLRDASTREFQRVTASVAHHLRRLAGDLETEAKRIDLVPGPGELSAAAITSRMMHTWSWGLANAGIDRIATARTEP